MKYLYKYLQSGFPYEDLGRTLHLFATSKPESILTVGRPSLPEGSRNQHRSDQCGCQPNASKMFNLWAEAVRKPSHAASGVYPGPILDDRGSSIMNRLGLALSGGGFRAVLYHLGLVRFLRDAGILPRVTHISAVSGGSIIGAHLVLNWDRYNGSPHEFETAASELYLRRP